MQKLIELAMSIQWRGRAGACRADGDKGREAGDLVLMLLFWVSLDLNLALLWGLSYPNCSRDGGNTKLLKVILFFKFYLFVCFQLHVDLCCSMWAFSLVVVIRDYSLIALLEFLIAVASLVAEHKL